MIKKRLDKLSEEDFAVLNGPLKSGRQSPESLGGILLLTPFIVGVFLFIGNLFVFMDSIMTTNAVIIFLILLYTFIRFYYAITYIIYLHYDSDNIFIYMLLFINNGYNRY